MVRSPRDNRRPFPHDAPYATHERTPTRACRNAVDGPIAAEGSILLEWPFDTAGGNPQERRSWRER